MENTIKEKKQKETMKLPLSFYREDNVVKIAKKLLGKVLYSKINEEICGGIIVETESYNGISDKASHAYKGRFSERTKVLYENGGVTYVYLCYGMHHLLNVVTDKKNIPSAVLIRAIEPTVGINAMLKRKNKKIKDYSLSNGPGALCKALGITKKENNLKLTGPIIWIEDKGFDLKEDDIIKSPRVGVAYAGQDAFLPWRFRIKNNKWTSPAK